MARNVLPSETSFHRTGCGGMFVHICFDNRDVPRRVTNVRVDLGKAGGCAKAFLSSYCELLDIVLTKFPTEQIPGLLAGAAGHKCQYGDKCCTELISRHITEVVKEELELSKEFTNTEDDKNASASE